MKRIFALTSLVAIALVAPTEAQESKLVQFHMAVFKNGPNANDANSDEGKKIHGQQRVYFEEQIKSGKVVLGGPFADDGEVKGIMVYRAKDAAERPVTV